MTELTAVQYFVAAIAVGVISYATIILYKALRVKKEYDDALINLLATHNEAIERILKQKNEGQ